MSHVVTKEREDDDLHSVDTDVESQVSAASNEEKPASDNRHNGKKLRFIALAAIFVAIVIGIGFGLKERGHANNIATTPTNDLALSGNPGAGEKGSSHDASNPSGYSENGDPVDPAQGNNDDGNSSSTPQVTTNSNPNGYSENGDPIDPPQDTTTTTPTTSGQSNNGQHAPWFITNDESNGSAAQPADNIPDP